MFKTKIKLTVFLALLVPFLAQAQLEVTTKGSAPSRKLKIKKSKVPSFDFKPGQEIPRLDIGTENELVYKETQLNLPQSQLQNEKIRKPNILKMVELDKKAMAIPGVKFCEDYLFAKNDRGRTVFRSIKRYLFTYVFRA
jgi:hypothetical protein